MGKLYRSNDRVIAGVCAGLAKGFGLDTKLVRILTVVAALITGGIVLLAYLILALVLPAEGK
ncbi:MAG: PspC domain-containing protein [Bacteroidaceae bacterium]|nr:PspC domain-containing protein [Bacteroidaceae bacterium]